MRDGEIVGKRVQVAGVLASSENDCWNSAAGKATGVPRREGSSPFLGRSRLVLHSYQKRT